MKFSGGDTGSLGMLKKHRGYWGREGGGAGVEGWVLVGEGEGGM